ncbi:MAG: hypothetical protein NDJ90_01820 [Oligoflexia bacterium]|nr:hypothetical protein [Oligoflexia bacterium]
MVLLTPAALGAPTPTAKLIESEISANRARTFGPLLKHWDSLYGSQAVKPLAAVAANRKLEDHQRYVALMGIAKLGGPASAPVLEKFLKDPSWMLRSGALRALASLGAPQSARFSRESILPLLKDPALVVRKEAVEAVARLKPQGSVEALLSALERKENYHGGRALWVPQRILVALRQLKASQAAPRLLPLLDHSSDPELQLQALATLESLTGTIRGQGLPLPARIREWKVALRR